MTNEPLYGLGRNVTGPSYALNVRHGEAPTAFDEILGNIKPVSEGLRNHFEISQTPDSKPDTGSVGLMENQGDAGVSPELCRGYGNLVYGKVRGSRVDLSV